MTNPAWWGSTTIHGTVWTPVWWRVFHPSHCHYSAHRGITTTTNTYHTRENLHTKQLTDSRMGLGWAPKAIKTGTFEGCSPPRCSRLCRCLPTEGSLGGQTLRKDDLDGDLLDGLHTTQIQYSQSTDLVGGVLDGLDLDWDAHEETLEHLVYVLVLEVPAIEQINSLLLYISMRITQPSNSIRRHSSPSLCHSMNRTGMCRHRNLRSEVSWQSTPICSCSSRMTSRALLSRSRYIC